MGHHLTQGDRYYIKAQRDIGKTIAKIASKIKVDKSTLSRELNRNCGQRGYRPKQAQKNASRRWKNAAKAIKLTPPLKRFITKKIRQDWCEVARYLK